MAIPRLTLNVQNFIYGILTEFILQVTFMIINNNPRKGVNFQFKMKLTLVILAKLAIDIDLDNFYNIDVREGFMRLQGHNSRPLRVQIEKAFGVEFKRDGKYYKATIEDCDCDINFVLEIEE